MDAIEWFQKFIAPLLTFDATLVKKDGHYFIDVLGHLFAVSVAQDGEEFWISGDWVPAKIAKHVTARCADHVIAIQYDRIARLRDALTEVSKCPHCPSCAGAATAVLDLDGVK